jgi:hypothetical protein
MDGSLMRGLIALLFCVSLQAQVLLPIVSHKSVAPVLTLTVEGGTFGPVGTTSTANNSITMLAGDQGYGVIQTATSASVCTGQTPSFTSFGSETVSFSSPTRDNWAASTCIWSFTIQNAAGGTYTPVLAVAGTTSVGWSFGFWRHSANAVADYSTTWDNATGGGTTAHVIPNSGNTSTIASGSIVVMGIETNSFVATTATTSGCFGATGTIFPNQPSPSFTNLQWVILGSSAASTCAFTTGSATVAPLVLSTFH